MQVNKIIEFYKLQFNKLMRLVWSLLIKNMEVDTVRTRIATACLCAVKYAALPLKQVNVVLQWNEENRNEAHHDLSMFD